MKTLLFISYLFFSINSYACTDVEADIIVKNRAEIMAKRYSAKKMGIGVSMLWGNTRITNIALFEGTGSDDGTKVDRMGSIYINMDNCVVQAKLIGIFDTFELSKFK